jgi:hypothetical protein
MVVLPVRVVLRAPATAQVGAQDATRVPQAQRRGLIVDPGVRSRDVAGRHEFVPFDPAVRAHAGQQEQVDLSLQAVAQCVDALAMVRCHDDCARARIKNHAEQRRVIDGRVERNRDRA